MRHLGRDKTWGETRPGERPGETPGERQDLVRHLERDKTWRDKTWGEWEHWCLLSPQKDTK